MKTTSHAEFVGRRGELTAELFLQELQPKLLARPTSDFGYDFLVSFANSKGGLNTFAVAVKGTERTVSSSFALDKGEYRRLVNSNLPGFLLVVDVKQNKLFYALPKQGGADGLNGSGKVNIALTEVNAQAKDSLRRQLIN
jgi:hypothetical protein